MWGEVKFLIWITAAWMERPNCVTWDTHLRAPKRNVCWFCRCYLFFLHLNFYFKTFLPLFSFRQWCSVSLRNISEWAIAGLWTLMFSRTLGQKHFLDVCLHRPFLVDVIHHKFFKGFSLNNAQMSSHTRLYKWLVFFNLKPWNIFISCLKTYSLNKLKPAGIRANMWLCPEFTSNVIN